jgi:PadR family transcriptional regulator, regulatory protein PadR
MSINKDLVAASSTPLVLAILAEGDSYGYAILQRVRELSGGELEWTDGMLYPVLHRLERPASSSPAGRRRRRAAAEVLPGDGGRTGAAGRGAPAVAHGGPALRKIWSALADP